MVGNHLHVKKGDTVMVLTGKDKNKTGKILQVFTKKERVVVEGLNVIKRHTRARGNEPGGIIEKEAPIHISNVLVYCAKCAKGVRTSAKVLDDGKKVRACAKCGETFEK